MQIFVLLFGVFALPLDLSDITSIISNPQVASAISNVVANPNTITTLLPMIENILKQLLGLLNSNGGQLPTGIIPSSQVAPEGTPSGTPTGSSTPAGIPSQYASYWNKVPAGLQAKLSAAISSGKIKMADIQKVIANKDYAGGYTLLTSAGLSLDDVLSLKSAFGQ